MTTPTPGPIEADESTATWDADPFEVVADWSARTLPLVHLDQHVLAPGTARRVAAVLLAAADRAEAGQ